MSTLKVIQPIMDAAESLEKAEIVPEDQKFKILKQHIFKGRDILSIEPDAVFAEILQEIQKIPSLSNEIIESESLRINIIKNLGLLKVFFERYLISHEPLDKTPSEKLIMTLETTILEIERLPKKTTETVILQEEIKTGLNIDKIVDDLREASTILQSASTYEEIQKGIEKAIEAKKLIDNAGKEKVIQAEVFIQAIEEKIHLFVIKQINIYKKTNVNKESLKKLEDLAQEWSGSHKEYLLEQIDDLYNKN